MFDDICQVLLKTGGTVLRYKDPELFFVGQGRFSVSDKSVLAMGEFDHPDDNVEGLEGHVEAARDSDDAFIGRHPSMVAQTLLGNFSPNSEPSGQVRSYIIGDTGETVWDELNRLLAEVLADIDSGHRVAVINFSIGFFNANFLDKAFDNLMQDEVIIELQNKIEKLKRKGIPIVIAAGDEGRALNGELYETQKHSELRFFNFMSVLDPSLIIVGASQWDANTAKITTKSNREESVESIRTVDRKSLANDITITEFSSPGNSRVRPDVLHIGAGYSFLKLIGLEEEVAGTSFSAPLVARLIAVMKSVNSRLSTEMIQAIIKKSAKDLPETSPEYEGAGQVQAEDCVFIAFLLRAPQTPKRQKKIAAELGIDWEHAKNLRWLSRKIRMQVLFKDTFDQSYGE